MGYWLIRISMKNNTLKYNFFKKILKISLLKYTK